MSTTRIGVNERKKLEARRMKMAESSSRVGRVMKRLMPWVGGACALVLAGWLGFRWLESMQIGAKLFSLQEVEVAGNGSLPATEIVQLLGVELGTPLRQIPLAALEKKLASHPGILQAKLSRSYPSTLVVEVAEARPVALVHVGKGWVLLTEKGALRPVDAALPGLPVAWADTSVAKFLTRMLDSEPALFSSLSQVAKGTQAHVYEVFLRGRNFRALFREDAHPIEFRRYLALIDGVPAKETDGFTEIDMRFAGFAVARGAGSGT